LTSWLGEPETAAVEVTVAAWARAWEKARAAAVVGEVGEESDEVQAGMATVARAATVLTAAVSRRAGDSMGRVSEVPFGGPTGVTQGRLGLS
jgi:hypothetical protein